MKKILAMILALLMLLSCAMAEESSLIPSYDELIVGTATPMSGSFFTSLWGDNTADMDVRALIHGYELVRWNGEQGTYGMDDSVVSGLVVTDDINGNRTYTVAIYDDLRYNDGTPITAADYVFSILFSVSPQVREIGGTANTGDSIVGIENYVSGRRASLLGVRLLDTYQFSLTVKAESLPFFYELSVLSYAPMPISVIAPGCEVADNGQGAYIRGTFTADVLRATVLDKENGYLSHPLLTCGPYMLKSYDDEAKVATFESNPYYKGNNAGETPRIAKLTYKWVSNEDAVAKLESGEIGLMNKCVSADVIANGMQLLQSGTVAASNYTRSGFAFINFNCERAAMASSAVRKAIAHCMDKDAYVQSGVGGFGQRVDGYYGLGQWMYRMVSGAQLPQDPEEDTPEAKAAYEREIEQWEKMNLDRISTYDFDTDKAAKLLEEDGWKVGADGIREKDGVKLSLTLLCSEGSAMASALEETLVANLKTVGIELKTQSKPFDQVLRVYYRQDERDCDMILLATNFGSVFDPALAFDPTDAQSGAHNRTASTDASLYALAQDMRATEPGDALTYCQKWLSFQTRWAEVLPALPLYSNVYFDFYTPTLQNYNAGSSISWAEAIVSAYLGDAEPYVPDDDMETFGD